MTTYDERLVAPWWCWVGALVVSLLLAAGIHSGADGARAVVPYVLLPLGAVLLLAALSRGRVRVVDGELRVRGARAPLAALGPGVPLDRDGLRQVRGPLADPRAHLALRPWLSGAVRVPVVDPADDTPYWLVGTRHPQALVAALTPGGRGPSS